jgi:hypothetical protein
MKSSYTLFRQEGAIPSIDLGSMVGGDGLPTFGDAFDKL